MTRFVVVAVLRRGGEVAGHLATQVSTFWSPLSFSRRRQWHVWHIVVWTDGHREPSDEDYPPLPIPGPDQQKVADQEKPAERSAGARRNVGSRGDPRATEAAGWPPAVPVMPPGGHPILRPWSSPPAYIGPDAHGRGSTGGCGRR
ncbi:hypothetical protein F4558_005231 [Micromonospora profundi]|uniref:hypothetical protein n=1 Tax=Micromonospora profundi TaxID=1420889 RepID=UPI00143A9106|nr:hypothetical protein [Micromonospora profundi]NJC15405.1 hypothetical protein [Micromonospora profundi]